MSATLQGSVPRLDGILARAALSVPQREAVVFGGKNWSYAQVHDRARRLAGALEGLGVQKGDRVALWTANRAEFVEIFFGVPMLGAIAAPLDLWWTWKDAEVALAQLRPKVLIIGVAQAEAAAEATGVMRECGIEHVFCLDQPPGGTGWKSYADLIEAAPGFGKLADVVPADPALILFTSGSTGRSKGAVHTHGSLMATAMTMSLELELLDGERTLHFLPMFSSCLEHLLPLTLMRATHVILAQFDAASVWESARAARITHINAVPTTLRRLLGAAPRDLPPCLRVISYASERMPQPLVAALIERMPNVRFVQFYGMIEHLCLTVLGADDQLRKAGTVGRPMIGAQLYLLHDPSGGESQSVGEIVASSPSLFAGYWQDASATASVVSEQWMRTGDVGRFDQEGFLLLDGRIKEMIKSGGMTVIPAEVEEALMAHPEVSEVAVVGVPDEQWGEAVHAFAVLAPGASVTQAQLKAFSNEQLSGYKRPKVIHIVAELPRTGIGKIARRVVREWVLASGPH